MLPSGGQECNRRAPARVANSEGKRRAARPGWLET